MIYYRQHYSTEDKPQAVKCKRITGDKTELLTDLVLHITQYISWGKILLSNLYIRLLISPCVAIHHATSDQIEFLTAVWRNREPTNIPAIFAFFYHAVFITTVNTINPEVIRDGYEHHKLTILSYCTHLVYRLQALKNSGYGAALKN